MRHFLPFVVIILLSGLITCKVQDEQLSPDLLHFDATGDTMALDLAAQVLETNGGQQAWSESRYVAWTFFGRRRLVWDKWGRIHLRRRVLVGQQRVGTHRGEVLGEHGDAEADLRRKQLRDPGEGPLGVASLSLDVDAETLT